MGMEQRNTLSFDDVIGAAQGGPLQFALGTDDHGGPVVCDLEKMGHLLIGGATGSGKSNLLHSMILSFIKRATPGDVRLILIDPKRVEFTRFNHSPHLYAPVITDAAKAASALLWCEEEMMRRQTLLANVGVSDIASFNRLASESSEKMAHLVVVIDELADLMGGFGKVLEVPICRIAQLGAAAGIHLVIATQCVSSTVITGLIKAGIPNRIALAVASGFDSRMILGRHGAEKLQTCGEMLLAGSNEEEPAHIQACLVSEEEVNAAVLTAKELYELGVHPEIEAGFIGSRALRRDACFTRDAKKGDNLLWEAAELAAINGYCSYALVQRRLRVGYSHAMTIMAALEALGVVESQAEDEAPKALVDIDGLFEIKRKTRTVNVRGECTKLPEIYLLDRNSSMVAAWQEAFEDAANVIATRGDFARFMDEHPEVDCVVSPANSFGIMDGGYDRAITNYFGHGLMEAVQRKIVDEWLGEQPVGTSISVEYNGMTLIHTPVMRVPSVVVDPMLVYHCMRTALIEAMRCGVETKVIPAWGTGCGMLPFDTVADLMAAAYFQVKNPPSKLDWDYANSRQLPDMDR